MWRKRPTALRDWYLVWARSLARGYMWTVPRDVAAATNSVSALTASERMSPSVMPRCSVYTHCTCAPPTVKTANSCPRTSLDTSTSPLRSHASAATGFSCARNSATICRVRTS